jgi:2-(1,2-epoxy-1,2-dihydrophenyl)acetyl-CoA isomerase
MNEPVRCEVRDHVAVLTMGRPEALNALDLPTARALADGLLGVSADPGVRAVILTGEGRAFSSGGDLRGALAHPGGLPTAFRELATFVHLAVTEIRRMPKAVIAAVNGVAAGGGFSLALACDFRVVASSARLIQGYTSQGLVIDGGGTFTLPRLVGTARALEIAAFDEPISADQALSWGLVTRVVPDDSVMKEARAMAAGLTLRSVNAFAAVKRLLNDSSHQALESQLEAEREALITAAAHPDAEEGISAFAEKRRPVYWPNATGERARS